MDKKHGEAEKADARESKNDIREAVTSADDTGMLSGEELITEAETILPTLPRT